MPPSTGYDKATMDNPGGALTDFSLLIDLSTMSSDWWTEQDDTDATKGRAFKDDGTTELPIDWIDFDAGAETGWARVSYDGTMAASGTQIVRLYPPNSGNAAVAAGDTYGSDNAYDANWTAYWPFDEAFGATGTHVDRTSNGNDLTWANRESEDFVTGKVGGAIRPSATNEQPSASSAIVPTGDFTLMAWWDPQGAITASDGDIAVMSQYAGGQSGRWWLGADSSAKPEFFLNGTRNVGATTMSNSGFQHIAVSRSGTAGVIYLDGSSDGTFTDGTTLYSGVNTKVAALNSDYHDEPQIHGTGRSGDWIAQEYAQSNDQGAFWNHAGTWAWTAAAGGLSIPVAQYHYANQEAA